MPAKISLIGKTFGRLKVISQASSVFDNRGFPRLRYNCICECGKEIVVLGQSLRAGLSESCGCLHSDIMHARKTHGHSLKNSPTYRSWVSMKTRCFDKTCVGYKHWGGRGITVCERWMKFENFLEDMGERPHGKFIERINNDGNYCKENCKWATKAEQARNNRRNRILTINGVTACLIDHAARAGLHYMTVYARVKYGWKTDDLLLPSNRKKPWTPKKASTA